jgi:hypothetical protein
MVSAYDLDTGPGVSRGAISAQAASVASTSGSPASPAAGIAAAEVRPSILLDSGLIFAVGFRAGKAGLGDGSTALVGGDLSVGFQHRFGPFIPFIKAMFGFNSYDQIGNTVMPSHVTDLRLDAVVGTRLYVTRKMFLAASGFAGWGDRYGAALAVGGDVVQFFRRGVMP